MTAPDSRDSVAIEFFHEADKLASSMAGIPAGPTRTALESEIVTLRKCARRLQALARGPQQAGGEDAVQAAARIASEAACLRIDNERLQAEVARLTRAQITVGATTLTCSSAVKEMFDLQQTALREAHEGEVSQIEWEDSDRIIVHIEKDEGDVMMWEDVREGVRVRIAGPRLVRDGDSGEGYNNGESNV